ncbi:hypothetical protein ACG5V6_08830 [Streptomyces chitinivorans]|uniref:Uncharacterized protein n=1 Tax=Streptomyces chitinivorans TaxID=1257027 RepID=A0ABW7HRS4_9ACTN|nr:hypothetical protein [Streptomyces chitinivorans]MDH2409841.1 hypothetical protein [Streptomyces chitinivorans]
MAQKPVPKHLKITIDFDLTTEGSTVRYKRAHEAYEVAVEAAIREAREVLPPDSVREITSEIDWSYRWQREGDVRFTRPDVQEGHLTEDDFYLDAERGEWRRQWLDERGNIDGDFGD